MLPEPEINIYDISEDDRFIVIASDGVWDYISNDVAARLIEPFYEEGDAQGAANIIV